MKKDATCATQGRGNIFGLWKKFPNIVNILINHQLNKLLSVIIGIWELYMSIKGRLELKLLHFGSVLNHFCNKLLWKYLVIHNWVAETKQHFPCLLLPSKNCYSVQGIISLLKLTTTTILNQTKSKETKPKYNWKTIHFSAFPKYIVSYDYCLLVFCIVN